MGQTRIVLVRHGESQAQERRFVGGHAGCTGLSDLGARQVTALRDRLASTGELTGATALYSSVMARAVQTAQILAPALGDLEVRQDCDFCESHPGADADGLSWTEFDQRWPLPADWTPETRREPGGETFAEMRKRIEARLDALIDRHPGRPWWSPATAGWCCSRCSGGWRSSRWAGVPGRGWTRSTRR